MKNRHSQIRKKQYIFKNTLVLGTDFMQDLAGKGTSREYLTAMMDS